MWVHMNEQKDSSSSAILKDSDALGALVLALGSVGSKVLSAAEHIDFLVSIREQHFKVLFDFWESTGWWLALIVGVIWGVLRFVKGKGSYSSTPSWGLVLSFCLMSFVFGSIIAAKSSGEIPRVITSWGGSPPCNALIDTSRLLSFRDDYKVGLICIVGDPQTDIMANKHILISNLFHITPAGVQIMVPGNIPGLENITGPTPISFVAFIVPNNIEREKIATMGDVSTLGGKLLDPIYYR